MDRRTFIKTTVVGGAAVSAFGFELASVRAQTQALKIARTTETRSTCPYCSVSCGVIIHTLGDRAKNAVAQVVHVEGDPDHPINRGTLCPKGASLEQDILNDRRLLKPQVRRPGSDHWEDISWDDALNEIARKVKDTRDQTFVEQDQTVSLDGTRLSTCVHDASDADELQAVGAALVATAGKLSDSARAHPGGQAELSLGYLVGAARRGAGKQGGERSELVRRLEQEAQVLRGSRAAYRRGVEAGGRSG